MTLLYVYKFDLFIYFTMKAIQVHILSLCPKFQLYILFITFFFLAGLTSKKARTNQNARPRSRDQRAEMKQKKYRYLYQVRTAHGDVISQVSNISYLHVERKILVFTWNSSSYSSIPLVPFCAFIFLILNDGATLCRVMCRLCNVKWYLEWCRTSVRVRPCSRMPLIWQRCQLTKLLSCHPASATPSTVVSVSSLTPATIIWAAGNQYRLTYTTNSNSMVDKMLAVWLQVFVADREIFYCFLYLMTDKFQGLELGLSICFCIMWFFLFFIFVS